MDRYFIENLICLMTSWARNFFSLTYILSVGKFCGTGHSIRSSRDGPSEQDFSEIPGDTN